MPGESGGNEPERRQKAGIKDGQFAKVTSRRGSLQAKTQVTERVDKGTIFMNSISGKRPLICSRIRPLTRSPKFRNTRFAR